MYEYPGYDHRITAQRVEDARNAYEEGFEHGARDGYNLVSGVVGPEYPTVVIPFAAGTEGYAYYDSGYEAGFEQGFRGDL